MDTSQEHIVKDLVREFIQLISQNNISALSDTFGISTPIFAEIVEALDGYGIEMSEWQPPVFGQGRIENIFQMNDPKTLGVEVNLWAKGKPQEPILHAEVNFSTLPPVFYFKYIGS